jgi:tripartite-type tricarboxylate transporter receptor subunit TctC
MNGLPFVKLLQTTLRHCASAMVMLGAISLAAQAQTPEWAPTKPVRIIVPIVGSTNDVLARLLAPKLSEVLGQPVLVENKPGAGGNLGINVSLFDKMPYDPVKDLAPITLAVKSPQYLVAHPGSGLQSVQDLVNQARANPTKFSYGSVAVGSASHLTMEMLKMAAGVQITHVPYKGAGPAVTDLIAGNIQVAFFVPGNVQQFAKDGRLRLLGVSGTKRFKSTPQVPTLIEAGFKDFEATSWIGLLTTGGTPKPIIERYHRELVRILQSPEIRQKLEEMEFEVIASNPDQFAAWIATEIPRWGKVFKATGAKAD